MVTVMVHYSSSFFSRQIATGVRRALAGFPGEHAIYRCPELTEKGPSGYRLALPQVDLVIGKLRPEVARWLESYGIPGIEVSGHWPAPDTGVTVAVDEQALARLAVTHFCERGYRRMAWVGSHQARSDRVLQAAFTATCSEAGLAVESFDPWEESEGDWIRDCERAKLRLHSWIDSLPQPTGCLIREDVAARFYMDLLAGMDSVIPNRLAMISIGDDPFQCLGELGLTSIRLPLIELGKMAGEVGMRLLQGEQLESQVVQPISIAIRESSDFLVCDDDVVSQAIAFMRLHLDQQISMNDIAAGIHVSTRLLYRRFQDKLGRSPSDALRSMRMELAASILSEEGFKAGGNALARRCGYRHRQQFQAAFKKKFGCTISEFAERYKMV